MLLTFTAALNCFACSEAMKTFDFECKAQDRYKKLSEEYLKNKVDITALKGFAIPQVIGNLKYFSAKNDLLNHTEAALKNYKDWQAWKNGQSFIASYASVFIDYNDIIKLHKSMFNNSPDAGKIRTNLGLTNPKTHFSCEDKIINDEISEVLYRYDVKSVEGYPLLLLENLTKCDDNKSFSADLLFYKGASMKTELKSWLADFNDMLLRYSEEYSDQNSLVSPYTFLSDMQRWFLAIHPFTTGNELIVNVLMDYATKKLALPTITTSLPNSILYSADKNRLETNKSIQENLTFFENCLYEIKVGPLSPQCSPL